MKSVRAVALCPLCEGAGCLRCTVCHGLKEIRRDCESCEGKASTRDTTGSEKRVPCVACEEGYVKCAKCTGPRAHPKLEDICARSPCDLCEGRGLLFKKVCWPCPACLGLGERLTPKLDPEKKLS